MAVRHRSRQVERPAMQSRGLIEQAELERMAYEPLGVAGWRVALSGRVVAGLGKITLFALNHWLALFNLLSGLLLLGTFLVPLLQLAGLAAINRPLYWFYGWLCLQRPTHSFFLFGYQMGMEVRMVAITVGCLIAGLAYATTRPGRALAYRFAGWLSYLFLSLPVIFDVFSQTFNLRDSDWFWRGITGLLFGAATVWFFYPRLERLAYRLKGSEEQE